MSSAARQRLLRFKSADQLTLGEEFDQVSDPVRVVTGDDTREQAAFRSLSADVQAQFIEADDAWAASPYRWVKQLPSVSRGRAGVALVERWARTAGLDIVPSRVREHNLLAGEDRVEVKLSTLWASGEYRFQSIREGGYDVLVLLGVSPDRVHLWLVPRDVAVAQLGNEAGNGWITVAAAAPSAWLAPYGGSPAAAHRIAAERWPARTGSE